MIIGNGLLANAFRAFKNDRNNIIFASGVSNSKETNLDEYLRELNLLNKTIDQLKKHQCLVYFSTTSIYDKDMHNNLYIKHKLELEQMIQKRVNDYYIFRLPEVVGNGGNEKNIVNYIFNSIRNEQPFEIWVNACRRLIDIDDIVRIITQIIQEKESINKIINITTDYKTSIEEIQKILEKLMSKKAIVKKVKKGNCYNIIIDEMIETVIRIPTSYLYNQKVIEKYFKNKWILYSSKADL